jgi:hyaluronoglucosaminidase
VTTRAALGVVEGFYGAPWSHEARRAVLRSAARAGLRAYLWAPKADPLHRRRWDAPPSAEHLAQTGELAAEARDLGVTWMYGLSPAVRAGATTDAPRVAARLAPVQRMGVRSFVVAFDDTWPTLLPRLASRAVGRAHGALARRVADALRARDPSAEVRLVPAIYAGRAEELPAGALAYLRGLAEEAADLPAAWTGPRIFSRWIRGDDVRALERATGLALWVWSNAVTNDWLPLVTGEPLGLAATERLPCAWLDALAPDLAGATSFVALNGAREADLTRVHVACLGAWGRDPWRHDARAAFRRALAEVLGAEGAEVLAPIVAATSRHALAAPARRDLARLDEAVATLAAALARGEGSRDVRDEVARQLDRLASLPAEVAKALEGRAVALEVGPVARKLAALGRAGGAALAALGSADRSGARAALRRAGAEMAVARAIRWDVDASAIERLVDLARRAAPRRAGRLLR